ncbi:hypothetical protein PanWU01x14_004760 [Parasponia andersonii]|uniref:Uncharacterized protein n=1 Tax=Parasponia andersonii TaxID=3476 RepID=A0A2P5E3A3_PARAD|nr:hypothetical protein PanWU01x14_004760 [Parasponia andersonii]
MMIRKKAIHNHIPTLPFEKIKLPQNTFPNKPNFLKNPLRRYVLHVHDRLQPLQVRPLPKYRLRHQPHHERRDPPPPVVRPDHVPDLRPVPVAASGESRDGDLADRFSVEADRPDPGVVEDHRFEPLHPLLSAEIGLPAIEARYFLARGPRHVVVDVGEVERPERDSLEIHGGFRRAGVVSVCHFLKLGTRTRTITGQFSLCT